MSIDGEGDVQSVSIGGAIRAFSDPIKSDDPNEVTEYARKFSGRINIDINSEGVESKR